MSELKTCFKRVDYDLSNLLNYIKLGDVGLPDIQRPFVWSNAKVRDLFDSMYRGFPVGYFLFWENALAAGTHAIGTDAKVHRVPARLIVDGQQRLTSLFAVFTGTPVLDDNFKERQIEIAFNPLEGKFDVTDATHRRDPAWISNISALWTGGRNSYQNVSAYLKALKGKGDLSEADEQKVGDNLDRLFDLQKYPFTALEIAPTVDEEHVADIFVRINSEGVKLNQADFILTLLSVFWDEGRKQLETFCREARKPALNGKASPFNHFIEPDAGQLLRVAVAYGFNRGRLKSVYQILRGKDVETGVVSAENREAQFQVLKDAQEVVLNLTNWHQFLSALVGAGYRSKEMVSSETAVIYSYVFYLIGRERFGVPERDLQKAIGRWFFASTLLGRYTSSPESTMDGDLNALKPVKTAVEFLSKLDSMIETRLTNDFWTITLPEQLDSSSARNPELFAYIAAQNRLNAPVLFSHKRVSDLLDPALATKKKALERHHLFPRAFLEKQHITEIPKQNKMANYALLEWPDNIDISDEDPKSYVPALRNSFNGDWDKMLEQHALPKDWHLMPYETFLTARRSLMADIIRKGFETLR